MLAFYRLFDVVLSHLYVVCPGWPVVWLLTVVAEAAADHRYSDVAAEMEWSETSGSLSSSVSYDEAYRQYAWET